MAVPFGKIFSCFMVCCMLGSTTFSALTRQGKAAESLMLGMLVFATAAMTAATTLGLGGTIASLVGAFFAFEACVGMYFPLIGTLRSKYLPDAYRGVIMNLFGIPLNLIVVAVFLSIGRLGVTGALTCSTVALSLATVAQFFLRAATAPPASLAGSKRASRRAGNTQQGTMAKGLPSRSARSTIASVASSGWRPTTTDAARQVAAVAGSTVPSTNASSKSLA